MKNKQIWIRNDKMFSEMMMMTPLYPVVKKKKFEMKTRVMRSISNEIHLFTGFHHFPLIRPTQRISWDIRKDFYLIWYSHISYSNAYSVINIWSIILSTFICERCVLDEFWYARPIIYAQPPTQPRRIENNNNNNNWMKNGEKLRRNERETKIIYRKIWIHTCV